MLSLLFINMFRGLPHEFYKYNVADTTDIRKGILDLPRSHFTPAVKVVINDCLVELKVLTRAGEVYDRSGRNLTARSRVGGIIAEDHIFIEDTILEFKIF